MANYLKDLVKKAKRIKTEKEQIKLKPVKKEVKTEDVRKTLIMENKKKEVNKTLILEKRKKEKERRMQLQKELAEQIPEEKEVKTEIEMEKEQEKEEQSISSVDLELESMDKKEIDSYGDVKVYDVPGKSLKYYVIPVTKPTLGERTIINTIKEAATRLISIAPYKIRDPEQRRTVYKQKIIEILQASNELNIPKRRFNFYAESVVREMVGYGLIDPLIRDDQLEEIMVIGPKKPVYIFHRKHEMMVTNIEFFSDPEIEDLINRIAREIGRRVDISSPLLDARLADGSRVNATIPPASPSGASLTIRKFRADPYSIIDLIKYGTLDVKSAAFMWLCVDGLGVKPANVLITGGTGSGKTTTLNVLASFIPERERIVTIEDTAELNLPLKHIIRLEARPPGLEGTGEITLDVLTKNSLRMRPDRVIVGEVRHDEAFTLFTAMNTGHDGCLGTIHANSPQETLVRVTSPPMNVPEVMLSGLDLIVVEHRIHDKKKGTIRRITEIAEVTGVLQNKTSTQTLFERDAVNDRLIKTNVQSQYIKTLMKFTGLNSKQIEDELKAREKIFEKLVKDNVHEMEDVVNTMHEYYGRRK
jgi:flagellar protein FlaI